MFTIRLMMKYDKELLLQRWSDCQCGMNLEYDPRFLALQQAATEKPEQQFGDTIIEAQSPDWAQVLKNAELLLEETADLRVLLLLTWARVERFGLVAYAEGLALLLALFQEHWESVHPQLLDEGELDPFPRMNALGAFVDKEGLFKAVRNSALVAGQHGSLCLRDAEHVIEGNKAELFAGGRLRLQELLKQAQQDAQSPMSALLQIEQSLKDIQLLVQEQLATEWAPDFSEVLAVIQTVTQLVSLPATTEQESVETEAVRVDSSTEEASIAPLAQSWSEMTIQSRDQALEALEKVCCYFETHEPSHPAPFLLRRVQQTIPMSFPEILHNLIPSSAEQFEVWMPKDQ